MTACASLEESPLFEQHSLMESTKQLHVLCVCLCMRACARVWVGVGRRLTVGRMCSLPRPP